MVRLNCKGFMRKHQETMGNSNKKLPMVFQCAGLGGGIFCAVVFFNSTLLMGGVFLFHWKKEFLMVKSLVF